MTDAKITSPGAAEATPSERRVLRELAARIMEIAVSPRMDERRNAWRASHDLNASRPVILVETIAVDGFKDKSKLNCSDPYLRDVEMTFREYIRHYEEINDDFVIDPVFRIPWKIRSSGYGIDLGEKYPVNAGLGIAYSYDYFIKQPEDIEKLSYNTHTVLRDDTAKLVHKAESAFGDIMPVKPGGLDLIHTEWDGLFSTCEHAVAEDGSRRYVGYTPSVGCYFIGICMMVYKLLGNENLSLWAYDHPETIHKIASFVCEDRIRFFKWAENEGLFLSNTGSHLIGSGPLGPVSVLTKPPDARANLRDIWGWAEAQEAEIFSPDMYEEFFLPYIAKACELFGLISYGCCEKLTDRVGRTLARIPNIRNVAVSPWNDDSVMAGLLGKQYSYCRKIIPGNMSKKEADFGIMKAELKGIVKAAGDCNLQVCVRDVYDVHGDISRLSKWADMAKGVLGI